jgi:hypothetical protein
MSDSSHKKYSPVDGLALDDGGRISSLMLGWRRPSEIAIQSGQLVYSARSKLVELDPARPLDPLRSFTLLARDMNDRNILRFATRWGVLGICKHGLPSSHNPFPQISGGPFRVLHSKIAGSKSACFACRNPTTGQWWEPLSDWQFWARVAFSVAELAVALQDDKPSRHARQATNEHWKIMGYDPRYFEVSAHGGASVSPGWPPPVGLGRRLVSAYITDWLELTGVRPFFFWDGPERAFKLGANSPDCLLATVGLQMMLLVNRSSGFSLCTNCGNPFVLRRGQSSSRNAYCQPCGTRTAHRDAQRRFEARKKGAR